MRRQLMCGLVAVAAVAASAAGVAGASASQGGPRTRETVARPMASASPGAGSRLWAARYNGPGNGTDDARGVAVSPDGATVFVTGGSNRQTSNSDYATVAYHAATGARLWAARYNGPGNSDDIANALAVSPSGGTVFVTGESFGTASGWDYATVAYNAATGARQWVARYASPGNTNDDALALAVSPDGRTVFVTGQSQGNSNAVTATVAYNAATGAQMWAARYNGPANGHDYANAMAVSPAGGAVFVTGYSRGKTSGWDYATVAYHS